MPRLTTLARHGLLPAAVGLCTGLLGALLLSGLNSNEADRKADAAASQPDPTGGAEERMRQLEAELDALRRREQARVEVIRDIARSASNVDTHSERPADAVQLEESPIDEVGGRDATWAKLAADFDAAELGTEWAIRARETLSTEVGDAFAEDDGILSEFECRGRRCLATIQWESVDAARRAGFGIMHHRFSYNCERHYRRDHDADKGSFMINCEVEAPP